MCVFFIGAYAGGYFLNASLKLVILIVAAPSFLVALFIYTLCRSRNNTVLICLLLAFFAILGITESFLYKDVYLSSFKKYCNGEHQIEGYVTERNFSSEYLTTFFVRVESIDGERVSVNAPLECNFDCGLQVGDYFSMSSEIRDTANGESNQSGFYDSYGFPFILSKNLELDEESDSSELCYELLQKQPQRMSLSVSELCGRFSNFFDSNLEKDSSALVCAIFLGNRFRLSPEVVRDFSRTGISHMLALSGLHVSILVGFLETIFSFLLIPRRSRVLIFLPLLLLYWMMTGFSLSAARALIMVGFLYFGYLLSAQRDTITSIFGAAAIIMLLIPSSLFDVGLWLSLLATLGVVALSPLMTYLIFVITSRRMKRRRLFKALLFLFSSLCVTISANSCVMLIICLIFGELSLISPLVNLLISPIIPVVLILAPLLLIFSFAPAVLSFLAFLTDWLCRLTFDITAYFSSLRGVVVSLNYDFALPIIIAASLCIAVMLVIKLKKRWVVSLVPTISILCFALCLAIYSLHTHKDVSAMYLSNGKSEFFIVSSFGEASIIDISRGYFSGLDDAHREAKELRATEISKLVLTHYHSYHITSFKRLSKETIIRELWLPEPNTSKDMEIHSAFINAAAEAGVKTHVYSFGEEYTVGNKYRLSVLGSEYISRSTHPIVALRLRTELRSLSYCGASAWESERAFEFCGADEYDLDDTIIYGLHGPKIKEPFELCTDKGKIYLASIDLLYAARFDPAVCDEKEIVCSKQKFTVNLSE